MDPNIGKTLKRKSQESESAIRIDSYKRIRVDDEGILIFDDHQQKMMMINDLEREVTQIQSVLYDMHIPETSLEIALIKLSLYQKGIGESVNSRSKIGVKRMGVLNSMPFGTALKGKCSSSSADVIADQSVLLCNFWEHTLKNQAWHPFKQVTLVDGKHLELIDEEDKLLKGLKSDWGKKAYSSVVNALVEMNEYNPSGRTPIQELWNFKEKRRATVMEGVAALVFRLRKYLIPTVTETTYK